MKPTKQTIMDRLIQIMKECEEFKIKYYYVERAATAMFEMETDISSYDIGKTEEEKAKDD